MLNFKQVLLPFMALLLIATALLYKLNTSQATDPWLLGVICILAILLFLLLVLDKIKVLAVGKDGLTVNLGDLINQQTSNNQTITDLIIFSMGEETYRNLQKLATGAYGPYEKKHYMGLESELYYLRNHGYIRLKSNTAPSIFDIPESDNQLSDYIEVTEEGKKYLELRKKR